MAEEGDGNPFCDNHDSLTVFQEIIDDSAVVQVVENIIEHVVGLATSESQSADKFIDSIFSSAEFEKNILDDTIKKLLNEETGLSKSSSMSDGDQCQVKILPVEQNDSDKEYGVNVFLDELGNYLPAEDDNDITLMKSRRRNMSFEFEDGNDEGVDGDDTGTWDELEKNPTNSRSREGIGSSQQTSGSEGEDDDITDYLKHTQILIDENRNLIHQVGEMKRAMAFLMSKYRNSVTSLLKEVDVQKGYQEIVSSLKNNATRNIHEKEVGVKSERVRQMLLNIVGVYEKAKTANEEETARLRYENQGLRQLVQIAFDYGGEHYHSYVDKSVQTEDTLEPCIIDNQTLATLIINRKENLDEYAVSFEREDDAESFHTANSLNTSFISVDQDQDDEDISGAVLTSDSLLVPAVVVNNVNVVGDHDKVEIESWSVDDVSDVTSETTKCLKKGNE